MLTPLLAGIFLLSACEGGIEGTGSGFVAGGAALGVLGVLGTSSDGGSGASPTTADEFPLVGLGSCVAQSSGQSLLCGIVTEDDGITPVAGVEVVMLDIYPISSTPSLKFSSRGVADENRCQTDSQGEYACVLPSNISGIRTFKLSPPSFTIFDNKNFQVNITAGETTTVQPQTLNLGDRYGSLDDSLEPIVLSSSFSPDLLLIEAVFSQSLARVQELLAQGEDPNIARNSDGATPLLVAAHFGYSVIVDVLIDGGANPNQGSDQFTPLMIAAQNGHLDIVTLLLEKGASVLTARDSNWTALHSAVSNSRENITAVLIEAGVPVDIQVSDIRVRGFTPLTLAAQSGYIVLIDMLLNSGANPLGSPSNGPSPLTIAAQNGHSQAAERLIVGGADPDNGGTGDAALVAAAAIGKTDVLEVLVLGGATIDISSSENDWTGLMWAANYNDVETVRELLRLGADRALRDSYGRTAREIAEALGHSEVVNLLF